MNLKNLRPRIGKTHQAFTLVELMVVIVIIAILAGYVGVSVVGHIAKAKVTTAKAQIKTLHSAVIFYNIDTGDYPETAMGLDALVQQPPDSTGWKKGGYLDGVTQLPVDPWGNEYLYQNPGDRSNFDIYSLGKDGQEGGEGTDADIYNSDVTGTDTKSGTTNDEDSLLYFKR